MKKQLLNKRLLFVVLSVALITMLSLTAFANVDKVKKAQSMVSQAELPRMYDTNGDKVFENLQVQMDLAKEGVKIPVMVMFNKQVNTKSELNTFMQGYEVKYQFQNIPAAVMELTKTEIELLAKMDFISHIEYDQPVHICMETANQWYGALRGDKWTRLGGNNVRAAREPVPTMEDLPDQRLLLPRHPYWRELRLWGWPGST